MELESVLTLLENYPYGDQVTHIIHCVENHAKNIQSGDKLLVQKILEKLEHYMVFSSTEQSSWLAFELLGLCLRILADTSDDNKLYEIVGRLVQRCATYGKKRELLICFLGELSVLRGHCNCFFTKVFPFFLEFCRSYFESEEKLATSELQDILSVLETAWTVEISQELDEYFYDSMSSINKFWKSLELSLSTLRSLKDKLLYSEKLEASLKRLVKSRLIRLCLDMISWFTVFLSGNNIFEGLGNQRDSNQSLIWDGLWKILILLQELSLRCRSDIFWLNMLLHYDETCEDLHSVLLREGMLKDFKDTVALNVSEHWSPLSIGCYLYVSLKLFPLEDDCFMEPKFKSDLYLPYVAVLLNSKWPSHQMMALHICRALMSSFLSSLSHCDLLKLLQLTNCSQYLPRLVQFSCFWKSSEVYNVNSSSLCSCPLLMMISILFKWVDSERSLRESSRIYHILVECIHLISDDLVRFAVAYFCTMQSVTPAIKALFVHEMKEVCLKTKNSSLEATLIGTHDTQSNIWDWLTDFLFGNFLVPCLRLIKELPIVTASVHVLSFIIWNTKSRLKSDEMASNLRQKLSQRVQELRNFLTLILDHINSENAPSNELFRQLPDTFRNRIWNECLLSISLIDNVLLDIKKD